MSVATNGYRSLPLDDLKIDESTRIYIYDDKCSKWSALNNRDKKSLFFATIEVGENARIDEGNIECEICMHETIDARVRSIPIIWHISNKNCRYLEKFCTKCVFTWMFHNKLPVCPICKTEIEYKHARLGQK